MSKLTLTNWFVHEHLELPLNHALSMVVGDHETGKSAIRDAICFAWTGTLLSRFGVRHKNEIGEIAIRGEEKKATVQYSHGSGQDHIQIVRTVLRSGKQSLVVQHDGGAEEGLKDAQALIYGCFGMDEAQMLAVLNSFRFLELSPEDAKAVLFRILGRSMTTQKIREAMAERALSEKHFELEAIPQVAAEQGFRAAEKIAVEQRQKAGRHLEGGRPKPQQIVTIGEREIDLEKISEATVEEQIRNLRVGRDNAIRGGAEALGGARRMLAELKPQVEELETKITTYDQDAHDDPAPLIEQKTGLEVQVAEKEEVIEHLSEQIAAEEAVANTATSLKKPETCEAFGVPCLATQAAIKKALAPIRQRAAEAKQTIDLMVPERARLTTEVDVARSTIERLESTVADLVEGRNGAERDRATLRELLGKVRNCEKVIEENEGAEEVSVPELDQRIELNRQLLQAVRDYSSAKESWEAEQEQVAVHREDHEAWDKIAQALKPSGIEAGLLAVLLPEFADLVNHVTTLTGIGTVSFTSDLDLLIERPSGKTMRVPQLSRSALLRLGIGIQHAIATLCRFPMLIVDELDVFNPKVQSEVMPALLQRAESYPGGILGLATLRTDAPKKPPIDNVAVWWLKDGVLQGVKDAA